MKHKTIRRAKQVNETICAQPRCRFSGKPAVQGVCFSTKGEIVDFGDLALHEAELLAEMEAMRKREGKVYVRALEAHYITAMMNWQLTLDECIRLRRDLALAKTRRR